MLQPSSLAFRVLPLFLAPAWLLAQETQPAAVAVAEEAPVEPILADGVAAKIRTEGIEHSQAMRLLRDLTGTVGHRLTGSDNFTKACDWAVMEFEKMGLSNVHKEKWGEWKLAWNRGTWKGRIVQPIELDMYVATEAWTASTDGPKKGRVVRAPAKQEDLDALRESTGGSLKGLFLYYTRRPAVEVRTACEQDGIAGWVHKAQGDAKYPTRVRVFGNHRVAMGRIDAVPKTPSIAVQSDHAEQLEALLDGGKDVVCEFQVDSSFREGPIELCNVIAEIPGTKRPDEVVIVCGHLDSWHQVQGCTDNGTGTTSTLEAARILAAVGARPERTIRFCLWGGEEQGLLGSAAYVRMHRTEMDKISAVFNHDTGTNWAAALTVTNEMYEPMRRVFAPALLLLAPDEDHVGPTFKLSRSETLRGGGGSDHASFIAAGVPGLNWSLKGRSDYFGYTWHSQWDTIDVAIEEYQRHTSTVIALAALGTANLPALLDRKGVVRSGGGRQAGAFATALFEAEVDGLKFTKVKKGGRGDTLGIRDGDVLVKANGIAVTAMFELFSAARDVDEGAKTIELELKRGDGTVKVQLGLEDLSNARPRRGNRDGERRGGGGDDERRGGDAPAPQAPAGAGTRDR
jgi:hypothetical protein